MIARVAVIKILGVVAVVELGPLIPISIELRWVQNLIIDSQYLN